MFSVFCNIDIGQYGVAVTQAYICRAQVLTVPKGEVLLPVLHYNLMDTGDIMDIYTEKASEGPSVSFVLQSQQPTAAPGEANLRSCCVQKV